MNKRTGLILLTMLIIVVIVVVVGLPDTAPEETELTVYTLWTPEAEKQAFETVLAEFEENSTIT